MSQHELSEEQAREIAAKVYEDDPAFPFRALPKPSQWNLIQYVRAGYAAANLAEAERKGAREVAEWVLDYWQKNLTVDGSGYGADRNADGGQVGVFTRKLRGYLVAPAPEVTAEMVDRAVQAERESYLPGTIPNNLDSPEVLAGARAHYRRILTAALRGGAK